MLTKLVPVSFGDLLRIYGQGHAYTQIRQGNKSFMGRDQWGDFGSGELDGQKKKKRLALKGTNN